MGICFKIEVSDLPEDAFVVNIESNSVVKNDEKIPKLPTKLAEKLLKKLEKYKYKYNNPVDVLKILYCDEVSNYCDTTEGKDKFNTQEIRNAFFEFFLSMFASFERLFVINKSKNEEGEIDPAVFNRDAFLKEHSSQDVIISFIYLLAKIYFFVL